MGGVTLLPVSVPPYGGLDRSFSLSSAKVCIKASHEKHMRSLQFRLKRGNTWTLRAKLGGQSGKDIKEVEGCFSDSGTAAYPETLQDGESWEKGHLSTEKAATITQLLGSMAESADVELYVYDHFNDGERG